MAGSGEVLVSAAEGGGLGSRRLRRFVLTCHDRSRYTDIMGKQEKFEKFSSKIGEKTLKNLRAYAAETERPISLIIDEAVSEYLDHVRVRSAFLDSASEVLDEHKDLLKRLAK